MKKKLGGIGTRSLIVILAVLVLVIIGLVIGIIVNINTAPKISIIDDGIIVDDENALECPTSDYVLAPSCIAQYYSENNDEQKAIESFNEWINKVNDNKKTFLIMAKINFLISINKIDQALNEMTNTDLSGFSDEDKSEFYSFAIGIDKKYNNENNSQSWYDKYLEINKGAEHGVGG